MKSRYLGILVAMSALATSGAALASDWYAVGSVGQSKVKINRGINDNSLTGAGATGLSSTAKETNTAYKLQLGYEINKYFAVEGGYVDLGTATYSATFTGGNAKVDYKAHGWNISAVGILPVQRDLSIFGKVGFITAKSERTGSLTGLPGYRVVPANATSTSPSWGVGISYNVTQNVAVRGEWERFNKVGEKYTTGQSDLDFLSVGLVYKF